MSACVPLLADHAANRMLPTNSMPSVPADELTLIEQLRLRGFPDLLGKQSAETVHLFLDVVWIGYEPVESEQSEQTGK